MNLQFRSGFFNILNHTNFNAPNPVVYASATEGPSPTAGVITSTATTSRQVQLGTEVAVVKAARLGAAVAERGRSRVGIPEDFSLRSSRDVFLSLRRSAPQTYL